jgi:hypothetical protein
MIARLFWMGTSENANGLTACQAGAQRAAPLQMIEVRR